MSYHCWSCGSEVELIDKVKRADTCEHCGMDLHCCKNCKFWDPHAHNECRESAAMHVYEPDKEKGNFCTHWVFREGQAEQEDRGAALSKLEDLFKK